METTNKKLDNTMSTQSKQIVSLSVKVDGLCMKQCSECPKDIHLGLFNPKIKFEVSKISKHPLNANPDEYTVKRISKMASLASTDEPISKVDL